MDKDLNNLNDSFLKENQFIFKKYKLIKKISKGTFGNIYSTIRVKDKNVFAMKVEKREKKESILEKEAYYLYALQGFGIPKLISYGHTKKYNILIETLLYKSLYDIFLKTGKNCTEIDASLIAIQILDRLEWIHSKNLVYRDVKPHNFMIGNNDPNVIYIIDFGLCKKYRSSKTGKHILPKFTGKFNGTVKYASFNAVRGKELSRRDDLISLGYMLVNLIKKELPWNSSFQKLSKEKYFELLYLKETNGVGSLFKNIPEEYVEFFNYTKHLKFEQEPDYFYLRSIFIKIISKKNLNYKQLSFSWIDPNNKKYRGIPKNKSIRRASLQMRILKSINEERIKKFKSETLNGIPINNNSNYHPFSINKNIQINPNEKIENNLSIEKYGLNDKLRVINIDSFKNLERKEKNIEEKLFTPNKNI